MSLQPVADGIWECERLFKVLGVPISSRMTVVRLATGELLLHSPVRYDEALGDALKGFGPVGHLVCPNRFHHLFVRDYLTAYPSALLYGAPGLPEKRTTLQFDAVLGNAAPEAWQGQIDQVVVAGGSMLNEVTFFHRASRSLILTDLVLNIGRESAFGLRLWARLNRQYGKLGTPIEVRLMFRDKPATRASIEQIMSWDFERIVVSHGGIVTTDAKSRLAEALAWVYRN